MKSTVDFENCLMCDGLNYNCPCYCSNTEEEYGICGFYKIVDNDLLKLVCGVRPLTFDKLEEIIFEK